LDFFDARRFAPGTHVAGGLCATTSRSISLFLDAIALRLATSRRSSDESASVRSAAFRAAMSAAAPATFSPPVFSFFSVAFSR